MENEAKGGSRETGKEAISVILKRDEGVLDKREAMEEMRKSGQIPTLKTHFLFEILFFLGFCFLPASLASFQSFLKAPLPLSVPYILTSPNSLFFPVLSFFSNLPRDVIYSGGF